MPNRKREFKLKRFMCLTPLLKIREKFECLGIQ